MAIKDEDFSNLTSGYTHSEFEEFIGEREYITPEEFNQWAKDNNIVTITIYDEMPEDENDLSVWNPEPPEGYRLLAIYDTEDGDLVVIWYKNLGVN